MSWEQCVNVASGTSVWTGSWMRIANWQTPLVVQWGNSVQKGSVAIDFRLASSKGAARNRAETWFHMLPAKLKSHLASCLNEEAVLEVVQSELVGLFDGARGRIFCGAELVSMPVPKNPVVATFFLEECALHEAQIVDNATWRRYCPRADHGHVLVGPLVQSGKMTGVIAVTRQDGQPAFGASHLRLMNCLSLYASTRIAEVTASHQPLDWSALSPREREVANYVCQGLRNGQIAGRLSMSEHTVKQHLKSIFSKLGLRSRTELAVHAAHRG